MKYEIKRVDDDTFNLIIGGNTYIIKKDVELLKEGQEVPRKAKMRLLRELAKEGYSYDDIIIKKVKDGKTIQDYSTYEEMLKSASNTEYEMWFQKLLEKVVGKPAVTFLYENDFNEEDIQRFTTDIMFALGGKEHTTPSEKKSK